jgi:WD40 repeat protein
VFTGSKDSTIKVWSQDRVTLKATLRGHQNTVSCLVVVGDILYSGSGDGTVKSWDINTLKEMGSSHTVTDFAVRSLAVDQQSDNVFLGCNDGVIRVLSVSSLQVKGSMKGHSEWVTSLAVRGSELYSASVDRSTKVWDIASFMCVHSFHGHSSYITSLVVAGDRLFSGSHDMTVRVWDLSTREEVSIIAPPGNVSVDKSDFAVRSLAVTNSKLYIGYASDSVSVVSLSSLEEVQRIHTKSTSFDNCLAVSNGKMFVGSAGKSIHVHLL